MLSLIPGWIRYSQSTGWHTFPSFHCVCSRAGSRVVLAPLGFHQLLLFPTIPRFKLVMWDKLVKDKLRGPQSKAN